MSFFLVSVPSKHPDLGLEIARVVRREFPDLRLTAFRRAPQGSALHTDDFDAVWTVPSWDGLVPDAHAEAIVDRLGPAGWFLPVSRAEVHWAAAALPSHERVLVPPPRALARTAGPDPEMTKGMPITVPETIPLTAPPEALHAFGRRHDWKLCMRAPLGVREPLGHWTEFDRVRDAVAESAADADALYLQRRVEGTALTLSFAAYKGDLLGAPIVRPVPHRDTYPVEPVSDPLRAALADTLAALNWTGGGTLDLIEDDDGTRWLETWRPGFGPEIKGAARCGINMPARLVAACTGRALDEPSVSTNTVSRVPITPAIQQSPADAPTDADPESPSVSSATLPSPPTPEVGLTDDLQAIIDDLPTDGDPSETPRSVLLPTRTQERFGAFTDATDRIEEAFDLDSARVGLSIKTNPADRLLATARETGMLAETIHRDEMDHARRHGYTTGEIIVNGPVQALLPDLDTAPYALFGDAITDLDALPFDPAGSIIGVRTRPPERGPSRFGVDLSEPDRMARLCDRVSKLPSATQIGLHLHAPSSTLGQSQWWRSVERVLSWAQTIQDRIGRPVECLDLGGGWHPDDWLSVFVPGLLERREAIRDALPSLSTILLEPGKALSQPLGVVVSRVLDTRPTRSAVIVDASLAELSNIDYHPHRLLAHTADRGWHRLPRGDGRVLGRLCMEADVLGRRRQVRHLSPGDTVVVCDAGAYDASMTYPFGRGKTAT